MTIYKVGPNGQLVDPSHRRKERRPRHPNRAALMGQGAIGRRWRRERKRYLEAHPTCATCGANASHVHHLDGLGPTGPRGFDWLNLQALCHSCHSQTTAQDQPGGWAA